MSIPYQEDPLSRWPSGTAGSFKPEVIIFDCDGVMFDSKEANEAYYNNILAHFGKPPMDIRQCGFVHMNTASRSVAFLFHDDPRLEQAQAYRNTVSYFPFISKMQMEPYLKAFLEYLKPSYKIAIATNRSDTMDQVLQEHGLKGYFDLVVSSLDVQHPKPAPEALLKILDFFAVSPQKALYIGDSQIDELTARAAGVPFIAYKNPKLDADHYVDDFKEMEVLLGDRGGLPRG